mmetsp:Transcript_104877/g.321273  ORF Transcript_104877/g.321273 Transcript_104877/m.321273 type:complete len:249 (+) Transcript_104877:89-835(+)
MPQGVADVDDVGERQGRLQVHQVREAGAAEEELLRARAHARADGRLRGRPRPGRRQHRRRRQRLWVHVLRQRLPAPAGFPDDEDRVLLDVPAECFQALERHPEPVPAGARQESLEVRAEAQRFLHHQAIRWMAVSGLHRDESPSVQLLRRVLEFHRPRPPGVVALQLELGRHHRARGRRDDRRPWELPGAGRGRDHGGRRRGRGVRHPRLPRRFAAPRRFLQVFEQGIERVEVGIQPEGGRERDQGFS